MKMPITGVVPQPGTTLPYSEFRGAEQIAQTGALSHGSAEVSGGIKSRYCRGSDP